MLVLNASSNFLIYLFVDSSPASCASATVLKSPTASTSDVGAIRDSSAASAAARSSSSHRLARVLVNFSPSSTSSTSKDVKLKAEVPPLSSSGADGAAQS